MARKNRYIFMVEAWRPRIDNWPPDVDYVKQIYMYKLDQARIAQLCGMYYNVDIKLLEADNEVPDGK